MQGLALTLDPIEESLPTYEVKGLVRGAPTEDGFPVTGIDLASGINEEGYDGITDYEVGDLVLLWRSTRFDDATSTYLPAPELDGVYRITELGHSHQNPMLERAISMTALTLIEVNEGTLYAGTFWKNLTLVTGYEADVSAVILEQYVAPEP